MSKYVALFSSKGYAIGENFAQWLAHKLKTTERLSGELIGHVEDLLAICGGRHAMGGQQFAADAVLLDMRQMRRVLAFDPDAGLV